MIQYLSYAFRFTLSLFIITVLVNNSNFAADSYREEARIDQAVEQFNVTGKNVAVAILDRGIDWKSNDFRNDDGSTRIAYIFDLTDDTGANWSNNPYGMGTIYTREQIDSALNGLRTLTFRDAVGHGTSSSGIILGNGNNSTDKKWHGVAPEATIICIKIVTEGAPAHDDQPAETPFYDPDRIPTAIDFAVAKSSELGMPCVMLLNIGSQGGPSDGTSELCRNIDETVGAGKPGLVFITGASDDGGNSNRAAYTLTSSETDTLKIHKVSTGSLTLDLWYDGNDRFDASIKTPSTTYGPYLSPTTNSDYTLISNSEFVYYQLGSNLAFYNPTDGKREIWLRIDGAPGDYELILTGATVNNGRYDATLNPSTVWNSANSGNIFQNHVIEGSVWDLASAFNNITPNCYILRTSWVDIDGITRNSPANEGSVGELWLGSGVGPTVDGRTGIDVSASGNSIITAFSPTSYWATFRNNLIQGGNGLYGMASAVSAASPIVTGIVALMLQMKPDLDAAEIKQILHESARADEFTGTVPNTHWGYGKVDALNALTKVSLLLGVKNEDVSVTDFQLKQNYPNPFNPTTKISWQSSVGSQQTLKVFDVLGNEIATLVDEYKPAGNYDVDFDASNLSSGVYFYTLSSGKYTETKKIILLK